MGEIDNDMRINLTGEQETLASKIHREAVHTTFNNFGSRLRSHQKPDPNTTHISEFRDCL